MQRRAKKNKSSMLNKHLKSKKMTFKRHGSNALAVEKIPQEKAKTSPKNSHPEKVRYSDEELQMFKGILLEKLAAAQKEYEHLKGVICHSSSNGTEDTSPTFKVLEEGASSLSKEETGQLAQRQFKFIRSLEAALIRVENKSYGICLETGKLIPKERLLIVPHTPHSIEGKEIADARKRKR